MAFVRYNTKQYKTLPSVHNIAIPGHYKGYITNRTDIAYIALCYKSSSLSNSVVQISNKN